MTDNVDVEKNKVIITDSKPSKLSRKVCKQLRFMFEPFVTSRLVDKHPVLEKYIEFAEFYNVSHFFVVSDNCIRVSEYPDGPTHFFSIKSYVDNFKTFGSIIYSQDPLITFSGESRLRNLFKGLVMPSKSVKRILHFHFRDDTIHIRHYKPIFSKEQNIKVGVKEIGPRLDLLLEKSEDGFFKNELASYYKLKEEEKNAGDNKPN